MTESAKLAFADREAWYGDSRDTPVPVAALLSAEYAASRSALVGEQASAALRPGAPDGMTPRLPGFALAAFAPAGFAGRRRDRSRHRRADGDEPGDEGRDRGARAGSR